MSFEQQMQQAMRSFIVEAQDLLEGMERGLMELEPQGGADEVNDDANDEALDGEHINALFRAAHTIKGSAGLFGLDGIVRFTHHLESVLDQMRAGKLAVSSELVALLLQGRDHLAQLIDQIDSQGACIADTPEEQALVARLQAAQQPAAGALVVAHQNPIARGPASEEAAPVTVVAHGSALTPSWHLSLRFGADSLRNGMDPLAFI
ncbi:MAG: Hpt domain-containing protein, partial [Betaproteobacteria bacterium]|nr:Hpt domain-containing protein [Betaproteobacteria bacterium]